MNIESKIDSQNFKIIFRIIDLPNGSWKAGRGKVRLARVL
jgi:hypothetical protein